MPWKITQGVAILVLFIGPQMRGDSCFLLSFEALARAFVSRSILPAVLST
jgi:hypothetical protein